MTPEYDLLTLGEILLRLSPPGSERIISGQNFEKNPGGAELNVACGGAALGLKTGIISRIPSHSIGQYVRRQIQAAGIGCDYLLSDFSEDARLGIYYFETGTGPRKPAVVYDRLHTSIRDISPESFPPEMYHNTRCFHTSGITLGLDEHCFETAVEMIRRFKKNGAEISFDVNFRGNLWNGESARRHIEQILPLVDIFFCSEDTARLTFGKTGTAQDIMKSFAAEYPMSVIASTQRIVHSPRCHSFGSLIYDAGSDVFYQEKNYENIEITDRIGSGDAYVAGALYGLLTHDLPGCEKAMQYGNALGALKCTIAGDLPLTCPAEVSSVIHDHQKNHDGSEMIR